MPWPTDPARRALAEERHRAAQRARWARTEERERARAAARAQFADPEARRRMSAVKLAQFVGPDGSAIRARISAGHVGTSRAGARRQPAAAPCHEARVAVARSEGELRARRRALIAERVKGRV